jgi:hypothetical protein
MITKKKEIRVGFNHTILYTILLCNRCSIEKFIELDFVFYFLKDNNIVN